MGARKPGPACATHDPPPDRGTSARCRHEAPGPTAQRPRAAPASLAFNRLWAAYPDHKPYLDPKTGNPPEGYDNQCAIKVSLALAGAGVDLSPFRGAQVQVGGQRAAVRAEQLAQWLAAQTIPGLPARPQDVTGADWQTTLKNRTGIVYFANYWLRPGETSHPSGDHIDLWNGWRLTASGLEGTLVTALRFGLGVDSGPGFSDLGKATRILFWEIP